MSLTPSYLADLATRRHDRILAAWTSSSAHGVDAVWRALTGSRNFEGEVDGFERASFDAEVAAAHSNIKVDVVPIGEEACRLLSEGRRATDDATLARDDAFLRPHLAMESSSSRHRLRDDFISAVNRL